MPTREELTAAVDEVAAETAFSGVVRVDGPDGELLGQAYGFADRAHRVPMTVGTRIGVASGAKTFTALTVMRLVEDGVLGLDTRARDLLGTDLPLVDDAVTVEQLLSHRSGIGDYLDEDVIEDFTTFVLPVPLITLDSAESYLTILDGYPQKFSPGTDFSYCNGAFCVLAILAERAARTPFHELVSEHVIERAGLLGTAYLRSDELPADAALGYLHAEGFRTNVLQLPVVGGGDGGIFTTAADVAALWTALDGGAVVSPATWAEMRRGRSTFDDGGSYGLGIRLWGEAACLVGSDAGATFRSAHVSDGLTWTVLSNTTEGAWPMVQVLDTALAGEDTAPTLGTDPFDVR
jgi:CubicO group peptidase (beta-lactamase class C family)